MWRHERNELLLTMTSCWNNSAVPGRAPDNDSDDDDDNSNCVYNVNFTSTESCFGERISLWVQPSGRAKVCRRLQASFNSSIYCFSRARAPLSSSSLLSITVFHRYSPAFELGLELKSGPAWEEQQNGSNIRPGLQNYSLRHT